MGKNVYCSVPGRLLPGDGGILGRQHGTHEAGSGAGSADGAEQVEHEHVAAQVHLVLRVGQGASNVSRGFDGLELEVVGIRLNSLTDHPGRLGITLSPDDDTALVLQSLLHNELGALRLLLGDLLGLNGSGILAAEAEVSDRHIIEIDEEVGSTLPKTVLNHAAHQLSLCDELRSVEAGHDALEDFIHDGRQNSLIVISAELLVNLG